MTQPLGAQAAGGVTRFAVRAPLAEAVDLCLLAGAGETRLAMTQQGEVWLAEVADDLVGARYGYRARGPYDPEGGLWFDPAKLLVDPYAVELDRRFVQHPKLAHYGGDTADIVPRAIVPGRMQALRHRGGTVQR